MAGARKRNRFVDYLIYLTVRWIVCLLQALPFEASIAIARFLSWVVTDVVPVRRGIIEENLQHAYPQMSAAERHRLTRRMWEHLVLMIAEIALAARKIHETNWREHIDLINREFLVESMLSDRPTVIVCAHFGNFELSGMLLGLLGFPSYTIARPLDNPYLNQFLNHFRGLRGQHILPKNGSAQLVADLLDKGVTLTLLGDQHAGPKGTWAEFFGRPASTHKAIALFSLANDAPMCICYCRRIGKPLRYLLGADVMIDPRNMDPQLQSVPALTQWYTDQLETAIRRAPEQYWWMHRRWRDTPPASFQRKAA